MAYSDESEATAISKADSESDYLWWDSRGPTAFSNFEYFEWDTDISLEEFYEANRVVLHSPELLIIAEFPSRWVAALLVLTSEGVYLQICLVIWSKPQEGFLVEVTLDSLFS
jgi:hypothetical protein